MIEQVSDPLPQAGYAKVVLELDVNNHPGVMSHICNLFARRAFNVEGILCMPVSDGKRSRIWLLVFDDQRLEQMVRQVEKLEDVLNVRRHGAEHEVFERNPRKRSRNRVVQRLKRVFPHCVLDLRCFFGNRVLRFVEETGFHRGEYIQHADLTRRAGE